MSDKDSAARIIQKAWRIYREREVVQSSLKKLLKRQKIAAELLETEDVYLSSLDTVINVFFFQPFLLNSLFSTSLFTNLSKLKLLLMRSSSLQRI